MHTGGGVKLLTVADPEMSPLKGARPPETAENRRLGEPVPAVMAPVNTDSWAVFPPTTNWTDELPTPPTEMLLAMVTAPPVSTLMALLAGVPLLPRETLPAPRALSWPTTTIPP